MIRHPPLENRYCGHCKCTTRHEVRMPVYTCQRCGVIKHRVPVSARSSGGFSLAS